MTKRDPTQIKALILRLEDRYSVDQWRIAGIHIWPYVRIKLFIHLLDVNLNQGVKPESVYGRPSRKGSNKLVRLFRAWRRLNSFYNNLEARPLIFFGAHFHRIHWKKQYYNRFFDTMIDAHDLEDKSLFFQFGKVVNPLAHQQIVYSMDDCLSDYRMLQKLKDLVRFKPAISSELIGYDYFLEELHNAGVDVKKLKFEKSQVIKWAQKILSYSEFFKKIYRCTKAERIAMLSYYGNDGLYAAMLGANQLGLQTIDHQHGPQTRAHMVYSSWNVHPLSGYHLMPSAYWCWDQASADNINSWARKIGKQAFVTGHAFLNHYKNSVADQQRGNAILYSLQLGNLEDYFPESLLQFMSQSGRMWRIRPHPRNHTDTKLISRLIEAHDKAISFVVEDPFRDTLASSLLGSALHLTRFSGCTLEAISLGVPTMLIDPMGKEVFQAYLDDRSVKYIDLSQSDFVRQGLAMLESDSFTDKPESSEQVINPLTFPA